MEIYNLENYVFSLILIFGGSAIFISRQLLGPQTKQAAEELENTHPLLRKGGKYTRRDGKMVILLGLIFIPLSFLYAHFVKQPQVDRQKAFLLEQQKLNIPNNSEPPKEPNSP